MSVGGPAGAGSMIGGRAGSNDEMRRAARRSSVMLTFRSISMRGLNHLTGFAKEKDRKEDDQEQPTNLVYGKSLEEVMALQMVLLLFSLLLFFSPPLFVPFPPSLTLASLTPSSIRIRRFLTPTRRYPSFSRR
jgi:quinol-cytochrome oxidoreductase complex cytochrome b subunit